MTDWISLLSCPVTHAPLARERGELVGKTESRLSVVSYPIIQGVPWLFPDPKHTLFEWRERVSLLYGHLESEIADLKAAIGEIHRPTTKERIDSIRQLKIHQLEYLKRVLEPLKPTKLGGKRSLERLQAFGYRLPLRQGLLGYSPNLIRDWCCSDPSYESENQLTFGTIDSALKTEAQWAPKTILVLGSGGSRLAYDIAISRPAATVIAFDLNPVLLLTAQTLNQGKSLQGVEMSVAPKDPSRPGRTVGLSAPHGTAANLHFAFGDVYHPPFALNAFDFCITPWLVDILPRRVEHVLDAISRTLKSGGQWLNFGSFRFDFNSVEENIGHDELVELAEPFGLHRESFRQLEVPYLQSEFDAHRRYETVSLSRWTKGPAGGESARRLPATVDDRVEWIRDSSCPIPALSVFQASSATHAVMALVLSLVDGKRTLAQISEIIAAENDMTIDEATEATASFFDRFLKDRRFREWT